MHRRAMVMSTLVLFGCIARPIPSDCPNCEPPSPAIEAVSGQSFLVTRVTFATAVDGVAEGLDLDGLDSGDGDRRGDTCEEQMRDHRSPFGAVLGGVDNASQGLISTAEQIAGGPTFAAGLDEAVAMDAIRWVVEVGAVDESEPTVRAPISLHVVEAGATIERDASGRAVEGQTLRTVRVAQSDAFVSGEVAFGPTGDGAVDLGVTGGSVFLIPFHAMRLRGIAVAADPSNPDALRANLGGSFAIEDLVTRSLELADDIEGFDEEDLFRRIYSDAADLEPSADRGVCERVSIGLGLEAIRVLRAN